MRAGTGPIGWSKCSVTALVGEGQKNCADEQYASDSKMSYATGFGCGAPSMGAPKRCVSRRSYDIQPPVRAACSFGVATVLPYFTGSTEMFRHASSRTWPRKQGGWGW